MAFPERFSALSDHAWPRLRRLLDAHAPGAAPIPMSIGEPMHPPPPFVGEVIAAHLADFSRYPPNDGTPELLGAISAWILRRYGAAVAPERLLALNGTREGLYGLAAALCPETKGGRRPVVLMPNPLYPAYRAAALSVGALPVMVPATAATGFLPDYEALPAEVLDRTAIAYACSPSNPQGAVADRGWWLRLLALAERHGFLVVADECYAEVWRHEPPDGVLAAAEAAGADPERVLAVHSLSKRSNLAGLRSGFAAGGPESIRRLRSLRAFAGAPLPLPLQRVSERAWADEAHVEASRALYREKWDLADRLLGDLPGWARPVAGFFLWLPVPDGEAAALRLWREAGVRVLPGAYFGEGEGPANPGQGYIRVALVAPAADVERGLAAIRRALLH